MTEQAQQQAPAQEAPKTAAAPSVHDRLKAFLAGPQPQAAASTTAEQADSSSEDVGQPKEPAKAEAPKVAAQAEADAEVPEGEATEAQPDVSQITSLAELAESTGIGLDRILDMALSTKIDGKDGRATIRELQKSYQLDGHLSNKLKTAADERKAFESERTRVAGEWQQKQMQMDAGLQVLQRALQGRFASVDWQGLRDTDPGQFNARYVEFQQDQAMLNHIADQIGQERNTVNEQQRQAQEKLLREQFDLLESKVPEWAGDTGKKTRETEISEMADIFEKSYGITRAELDRLTDHRDFLVARDALKWQKLQASKPQVLKKVVAAPKLLKPGTQQSQAAQAGVAITQAREQLRKTGKLSDAASVFKRLGVAKV